MIIHDMSSIATVYAMSCWDLLWVNDDQFVWGLASQVLSIWWEINSYKEFVQNLFILCQQTIRKSLETIPSHIQSRSSASTAASSSAAAGGAAWRTRSTWTSLGSMDHGKLGCCMLEFWIVEHWSSIEDAPQLSMMWACFTSLMKDHWKVRLKWTIIKIYGYYGKNLVHCVHVYSSPRVWMSVKNLRLQQRSIQLLTLMMLMNKGCLSHFI